MEGNQLRPPLAQCLILLQNTRRSASTSEQVQEGMFKQWYRRLRVFQSAENLAADSPLPDQKCSSNLTQAWMSQTVLSNQCATSGVPNRTQVEAPVRQLFRPIRSKVCDRWMYRFTETIQHQMTFGLLTFDLSTPICNC